MIKATELRIGNWICGVENDFRFANKVEKLEIGKIQVSNNRAGLEEDFFPIPLTANMLCPEFTKSEHLPIWTASSFHRRIRLEYNSVYWSYYSDFKLLCVFNYVHELQNIVFALEKIEIEIKPNETNNHTPPTAEML